MNLPVLRYLDVVIGLAVIMAVLTTVVLAITQMCLNMVRARPRHLQRALFRLIVQFDPPRLKPHAPYLAALLIRHPLVARTSLASASNAALRRGFRAIQGQWRKGQAWVSARNSAAAATKTGAGRRRKVLVVAPSPPATRPPIRLYPPYQPTSVIQREELIYMLLELAAAEGPLVEFCDEGLKSSTATARMALTQGLRSNGVEDPSATLRAIQKKALENERADPGAPASQWISRAVLDCAQSDFVGKLYQTFDGTIARATDSFSVESTVWVVAISLILALFLRLDSFAVLKRLAIDDSARDALVKQATTVVASTPEFDQAQAEDLRVHAAAQLKLLDQSPIALTSPQFSEFQPASWQLWTSPGTWWKLLTVSFARIRAEPGILLTWILLSLGAPFWFDLLKNALKLRSVLAEKDEEAREQRQGAAPTGPTTTAQTGGAPPPAPPAGPLVGDDEAGDLAATGALG